MAKFFDKILDIDPHIDKLVRVTFLNGNQLIGILKPTIFRAGSKGFTIMNARKKTSMGYYFLTGRENSLRPDKFKNQIITLENLKNNNNTTERKNNDKNHR